MPTYPPIEVTSTATLLRTPSSTTENQYLNNCGNETVYVGASSSVSTTTGIPLTKGSTVNLFLNGTTLYGITASGKTGFITVGYGANR